MPSIRYYEEKQRGTVDFPLEFYRIDRTHPRYEMPYHWHEETEILRVVSGNFTLFLDGAELFLSPGDCAVISGGCLHGGSPTECVYECVVFDLRMLLTGPGACRDALGPILAGSMRLNRRFDKEDFIARESIVPLFNGLQACGQGRELTALGHLFRLYGAAIDRGLITPGDSGSRQGKLLLRLKDVFDMMECRYRERLTLEDLASEAKLEKKYFCRMFKQATHMTPVKYLDFLRIEKACLALATTDKTVMEIALDTGFSGPEYFARVFRAQKGISPSGYRKEILSVKKPIL